MKLAALVLSCTIVAAPLELEWKVAAKSELERTFELDTRLELESRVLTIDGEAADDEDASALEIRSHATETYVFVDSIVRVARGRPAELVRRFEKLAQSDETRVEDGADGETTVTEFDSALEGRSVRFTWDEETGEYERELVRTEGEPEGAADAELVAGLVEDLDLRGILPESAVDIGEAWEFDVRALDRMLRPGGDLQLLGSDGEGEDEDFDRHVDEAIDATLKGKATARLASLREVEGRNCAVLSIEGETTANGEFEDDDLGGVTIELASRATGEIVWDLAAGHVVSAELAADVRTRFVRKVEFDFEGETVRVEDDMTFSGTTKLEISVVAR